MVKTGAVVCVAGKIGIGKTTITSALASCLRWPRAGFGDYVRLQVAARGGDPTSRRELQDFGQHLVASDPAGFTRAVLESSNYRPGGDLLVDGLRHVVILRLLADIVAPSRLCLIYLAADDATRDARVRARSVHVSDGAMGHAVEADLETELPSLANAVIQADATIRVVLENFLKAIENCGARPDVVASARTRIDDVAARINEQ